MKGGGCLGVDQQAAGNTVTTASTGMSEVLAWDVGARHIPDGEASVKGTWRKRSVWLLARIAFCTLLLAAAPIGLGAEGGGPVTATGESEAAVAGVLLNEYQVRPGDQLRMSVWGEPELATDTVVMTHGIVSFPLVGDIAVIDKTVSALTEELREAYLRYYQDPRVSLSVIPVVWPKVYVQGDVRHPGPVDYAPHRRLLDYVGLAGGFGAGADLGHVAITSSESDTGTATTVNVSVGSPGSESVPNPTLRPGDTIWVGKAMPISVVGAVQTPGGVEYQYGLRLSDYLGLVGGPTNRARLHKAVLKHTDGEGNSVVREVDLEAALQRPDDPQLNPFLAPGDVLSVPEHFLAGTLEWSDVLRAVVGIFLW